MKGSFLLFLWVSSVFCGDLFAASFQSDKDYDIIILGATPAGISAAISGAQHGKSCLILERGDHPGGMPSNGLSTTDLATSGAVGGIFKEFTSRVARFYHENYGIWSAQYQACRDGYRYEPGVAEQVFREMLREEANIDVKYMQQFDVAAENIVIEKRQIRSVTLTDRQSGERNTYTGKMFIDATYEGDLMAAAGVAYRVGRESADEYDEALAGRVFKTWGGGVSEESSFEGDQGVQAYNYRLCLTDETDNRRPIEKPEGYDREEYLSIIHDVVMGKHTGEDYQRFLQKSLKERLSVEREGWGGPSKVPGALNDIDRVVYTTRIPNGKWDANNQHRAFLSTDLPEENWLWPEADWEWRDAYAERLKNYTLGLLYFAQNDEALPGWFRQQTRSWGLAADEYPDNTNFPRQVYVREGRRMLGKYIFTARDALGSGNGGRPPLHPHSVTSGHYPIDSHGVRKREEGKPHLDGFISWKTQPFTVPYEVMISDSLANLLVPVALSASHMGFSALRMEPTWMALGQAAGLAAAQAIGTDTGIGEIDIRRLQFDLLESDAVLVYFTDIAVEDPGFRALQWMAVHGMFTGWEVEKNYPVTEAEIQTIEELFGKKIRPLNRWGINRMHLAQALYESAKQDYSRKQNEDLKPAAAQ